MRCSKCYGSGRVFSGPYPISCQRCRGVGRIDFEAQRRRHMEELDRADNPEKWADIDALVSGFMGRNARQD